MSWLRDRFSDIFTAMFGQKQMPAPQPAGLIDFASVSDLEAWFELHTELRMPAPNLCDDYSRESRKLAETDGYFLSLCLVWQGKVYNSIIFPASYDPNQPDTSVYHIANLAIVTSTEEVWYVDLAWDKVIKLCSFAPGGQY
jgi:hypothetical protein